MKNTILLIILLPSLAIAQPQNLYNFPVDSTTGKISFSGIAEKPGVTKDMIYTRAKIWIAQTFNSAKAVINMDDKESGILKIKGNFATNKTIEKRLFKEITEFDLFIYFKDGKYKYEFTNIETDPGIANIGFVSAEPFLRIDVADKNYIKYSDRWKQDADLLKMNILYLVQSLNNAISTKSAAEF